MATPVLIPVSEYLRTTYRPDCDYVRGELKERNVGETPHAAIQGWFVGIFLANRKSWGVRAFPEQRVQVAEENFRIPDVCAVRLGSPVGRIVRTPPLICIEILSEGQSLNDMRDRVSDYLLMGVENIWLLDPIDRKAWTVEGIAGRFSFENLSSAAFAVSGTPIRIPLADIYQELDDLAAGR